jgi:phenylacetate-CoA ligase
MDAVMYHVYAWHGIEIGAPQARFWGMPFTARARATARLKDALMNRIRCSAFKVGEADLLAFHHRLMTFRPEYFYGYPSVIYEFARFIVNRRLVLPARPLKAVIGTGELPLPQHRDYIERAFETRFVNEYGCSEVGVIAFQCPEGRMHVMAHNVFVEVVKDGRSVMDEEGEIVVTELNARTMPFLRYRMNDRGVLLSDRCACRLPLPLIEVSAGRLRGQLTLQSGRTVYDAIFSYTFKQGVAAFKAVQTTPVDVCIYVVPDPGLTDELMDEHLAVLREKTFGEIQFTVKRVDALPRERSGKLRYFVNELTSGSSWSADA